ncbi:unnamed protein product [Dicrocoelium dendriticum]|nr:unnamed protein product [Dicrocoelium dendriticum]
MRISVTPLDGDVFALDVLNETLVSGLKMLISLECGTSEDQFVMMKDGQFLTDPDAQLGAIGFKDGDLVILLQSIQQGQSLFQPSAQRNTTPQVASDIAGLGFPSTELPQNNILDIPNVNAEVMRQALLNNPELRSALSAANPELASTINNSVDFARLLEAQRAQRLQRRREWEEVVNADPLDPATQSRIADMIRQQNIDMHMESALEHYPETFAQVSMLFVNCKVGGQPIKAFVDSGAQSTIMSEKCAKRCNLERLIDKRWSGMAYGVGTQTIIGRVHNGDLEIEGIFLATSFIVLKDQQLDLMIGLDMLRRHQCCIDLKRNVLQLDGGRVETPFLPESEIPLQMRHAELMANDYGSSGADHQSLLDKLTHEQRIKVNQLLSQGVPLSNAISELESHGWDVQEALVSYVSNENRT